MSGSLSVKVVEENRLTAAATFVRGLLHCSRQPVLCFGACGTVLFVICVRGTTEIMDIVSCCSNLVSFHYLLGFIMHILSHYLEGFSDWGPVFGRLWRSSREAYGVPSHPGQPANLAYDVTILILGDAEGRNYQSFAMNI